jgi:hypothetical protein
MSGGSFDYVYAQVDDAASMLRTTAKCPEHLAFASHLEKVAKALHDIEWAFSGDTSLGDEIPAIMEVISPGMVLSEALAEAEIAKDNLDKSIARVKGVI